LILTNIYRRFSTVYSRTGEWEKMAFNGMYSSIQWCCCRSCQCFRGNQTHHL